MSLYKERINEEWNLLRETLSPKITPVIDLHQTIWASGPKGHLNLRLLLSRCNFLSRLSSSSSPTGHWISWITKRVDCRFLSYSLCSAPVAVGPPRRKVLLANRISYYPCQLDQWVLVESNFPGFGWHVAVIMDCFYSAQSLFISSYKILLSDLMPFTLKDWTHWKPSW